MVFYVRLNGWRMTRIQIVHPEPRPDIGTPASRRQSKRSSLPQFGQSTSAFVQINARRHSPDELQLLLPTRAIFGEREAVLAWSETFLDAHPVGTKLAGGHVTDVSIAEPGLTKPRIIVTIKAAHA